MNLYRISFYKTILSSNGQPFRCLQDSLELRAKTSAEAVQVAQLEYRRMRHIPRWNTHADDCEIEIVRESMTKSQHADAGDLDR